VRLSDEQIQAIRRTVSETAGAAAGVRVFGSRLHDHARGGDLDLLVELPDPVEHPAALSAQLSARIGRLLHGRRVDVVLLAPNLRRTSVHEVALRDGQKL
jgi:predicted nucleotidyltransferase